MPRSKTILQNEYPYNITARCINRDWFRIPIEKVWNIFSEELYLTNKFYNLKIHMFILMNNHFHLIASTPDSNLSTCMQYFMKMTSRRLTQAGNRINQTYAGRYYKTILHSHNYYLNAYKYNYQNPLVVEITNSVESYPFSTLSGLLGRTKLIIPVEEDIILFSNLKDTLKWLNIPSCPNKREAVKWALRRQYFQSKKSKIDHKLILKENDLL